MTEIKNDASKEKDINQVVWYLTNAFNNVTRDLPRAQRAKTGEANTAYRLQTAFAYLLNEVVQGPRCMQQRAITACNDFIDETIRDFQLN